MNQEWASVTGLPLHPPRSAATTSTEDSEFILACSPVAPSKRYTFRPQYKRNQVFMKVLAVAAFFGAPLYGEDITIPFEGGNILIKNASYS